MKKKKSRQCSLSVLKISPRNKHLHEKVLRSQQLKQLRQRINLYLPKEQESPIIKVEEKKSIKKFISPRQRAGSQIITSLPTNQLNKNYQIKKHLVKKIKTPKIKEVGSVNNQLSPTMVNPYKGHKLLQTLSKTKKYHTQQKIDVSILPNVQTDQKSAYFHKYIKFASVKQIFEKIEKDQKNYEEKNNKIRKFLNKQNLQLKAAPKDQKYSFQQQLRQKILKLKLRNPVGKKRQVYNIKQMTIQSKQPLTTKYQCFEKKKKYKKFLPNSIFTSRKQRYSQDKEEEEEEQEMMGWTQTTSQNFQKNTYLEEIIQNRYLKEQKNEKEKEIQTQKYTSLFHLQPQQQSISHEKLDSYQLQHIQSQILLTQKNFNTNNHNQQP